MIRNHKSRDYYVQKVKVIESIFVEFDVNFQIQHSTTNTKFVYLSLVRIHKKYKYFPKIFITTCSISVHQIVVLHQICYCLPGIIVPFLCSIRIHYFSTPDISRTSFYQKLLLQSARYCCIITSFSKIINVLLLFSYKYSHPQS